MYAEIEWTLEIDVKGVHQFAPKTMDYPGHDFVEDTMAVQVRVDGDVLEARDAKAILLILMQYPELSLKISEADWQEDG